MTHSFPTRRSSDLYLASCARLKIELGNNIEKLKGIDMQRQLDYGGSLLEIFRGYELFDTADKKNLLKFIPPSKVNFVTGELSLELSSARSEEQTSELKSLMRISYDVFCLNKKT